MPAALFCFSFFPPSGPYVRKFFSVLGRIYISQARPRFFAAPLSSSVRSLFLLLLSFPGARLFVLSIHSSTSPRSSHRFLSRCLLRVSRRDPDSGTDEGSSETKTVGPSEQPLPPSGTARCFAAELRTVSYARKGAWKCRKRRLALPAAAPVEPACALDRETR